MTCAWKSCGRPGGVWSSVKLRVGRPGRGVAGRVHGADAPEVDAVVERRRRPSSSRLRPRRRSRRSRRRRRSRSPRRRTPGTRACRCLPGPRRRRFPTACGLFTRAAVAHPALQRDGRRDGVDDEGARRGPVRPVADDVLGERAPVVRAGRRGAGAGQPASVPTGTRSRVAAGHDRRAGRVAADLDEDPRLVSGIGRIVDAGGERRRALHAHAVRAREDRRLGRRRVDAEAEDRRPAGRVARGVDGADAPVVEAVEEECRSPAAGGAGGQAARRSRVGEDRRRAAARRAELELEAAGSAARVVVDRRQRRRLVQPHARRPATPVTVGAAGGVVSRVNCRVPDHADWLPAASCARARQ